MSHLTPSPQRTRATLHERRIILGANGIATLTVTLDGLRQVGALPLASLTPGYNAIGDVDIAVKRGGVNLHATPRVVPSNGEFWLISQTPGGYDHATFGCRFSNGYALDELDASSGVPRSAAGLTLEKGDDALVHQAAFDVDVLTLAIELPEGCFATNPGAFARRQDGGEWIDEAHESTRLELLGGKASAPDALHAGLALRIPSPTTGHRYGIRYELAAGKAGPAPHCLQFLDEISNECRTLRRASDANDLSAMLTHKISDMCARVLDHPSDEELLFVGRLWSARKQQLLPAFGRFAPETWGNRFKYGSGIAGHAFRFGVGTCWMQVAGDADADAELIYRQREGGAEPDRHWIMEIPLFYCEGVAIGTLGFAAPKGQAANGSALGSLVAQIVLEGDENARARLDLCAEMASLAFWSITSKVGEARKYARKVFNEHWATRDAG